MITRLDNRSLLRVSGKDAQVFLQSQFSNDINKIQSNEIQLNAYCQHQGKIIAILWVFKKKEICSFYSTNVFFLQKKLTEIKRFV